ncbi:uncharacterized protein BDV14DRAFT_169872 [Aspergillus stella-maris]|uniref:uncharacterized protein n=1 Tax=Aspergillus stella-maris TaxID=1810926 RepID=UPI003CCD9358
MLILSSVALWFCRQVRSSRFDIVTLRRGSKGISKSIISRDFRAFDREIRASTSRRLHGNCQLLIRQRSSMFDYL